MKAYSDLAHLPEDDQIGVIGRTAEQGERVGFFVENDAKADRYIAKLTKRFKVQLLQRINDVPVVGTVFVRIGLKPDA